MTPSDSSERSASQPERDATQTWTTTRTVDESSTSGADEGDAAGNVTAQWQSGEIVVGSEAPPPWQRTPTPAPSGSSEGSTAKTESIRSPDAEDTQTLLRPTGGFGGSAGTAMSGEGRTAVSFAETGATGSGGPAGAGRRTSRGPRRASLQIKRFDPWSVLKLALVLSVAMFFVWMIAVAVLYGVLDGMGVWDQLNGTLSELTQPVNAATQPLISAGGVFTVAAVIGGINAVLMTALATVAAFIYNVASDVAGGIEVTLSERE